MAPESARRRVLLLARKHPPQGRDKGEPAGCRGRQFFQGEMKLESQKTQISTQIVVERFSITNLSRAALLPYISFVLGAAVVLLLWRAEAWAQTAPTGKGDYRNYCASCHGTDATGDKEADIPGPDLTHLSKKNGGRFPFQEVYEVIDGRKKSAAHERLLDMPLWGVYFQPQGVSKGASEAKVKSRITDLVRYIQSLQETQSPQHR